MADIKTNEMEIHVESIEILTADSKGWIQTPGQSTAHLCVSHYTLKTARDCRAMVYI